RRMSFISGTVKPLPAPTIVTLMGRDIFPGSPAARASCVWAACPAADFFFTAIGNVTLCLRGGLVPAHGFPDQLRGIGEIELLLDTRAIDLDGLHAQVERLGYFPR